jgi:hypothetical protein
MSSGLRIVSRKGNRVSGKLVVVGSYHISYLKSGNLKIAATDKQFSFSRILGFIIMNFS